MSYCVNCGVELDHSAEKCPLCNTPVINPADETQGQGITPFPRKMGQVEKVERKDMAILLSVICIFTASVCGIMNLFVFKNSPWSLAVIGVCVVLWVMFIPVVIYTGQSIYLSVLYDGGAVGLFLYMIARMIHNQHAFMNLGLPLTIIVTVVVELFCLCFNCLPRSFLSVALYAITAIALICIGTECVVDWYWSQHISLWWSLIVTTIGAILDAALITMLSKKRLRDAVRRRLHF